MRLAAVALVAVLAGCSGGEPAEKTAPPAPAPAASTAYPMTTCVVSGEPLGGMGEPVIYMHEGTEVRFCCQKCVAAFQKEPKKYMDVLAAARKK